MKNISVENTLVQFEIRLFTSRFTKTITAKKKKENTELMKRGPKTFQNIT